MTWEVGEKPGLVVKIGENEVFLGFLVSFLVFFPRVYMIFWESRVFFFCCMVFKGLICFLVLYSPRGSRYIFVPLTASRSTETQEVEGEP